MGDSKKLTYCTTKIRQAFRENKKITFKDNFINIKPNTRQKGNSEDPISTKKIEFVPVKRKPKTLQSK